LWISLNRVGFPEQIIYATIAVKFLVIFAYALMFILKFKTEEYLVLYIKLDREVYQYGMLLWKQKQNEKKSLRPILDYQACNKTGGLTGHLGK